MDVLPDTLPATEADISVGVNRSSGSSVQAGPSDSRDGGRAPASTFRTGRCAVEVYSTIDAIPSGVWDSLVGPDDLQATHRFIRTCEQARVEDARYRHLLVYEGGALAGVATLCAIRVKLDLLSRGAVRSMIRGVRRVRSGFLEVPVVFCALPVSFGQSCLRVHPEADAAAVLEAVHVTAESFAAELGAEAVCFKEFTAAETAALEPLGAYGYLRLPSLPSCRLSLTWTSFDDYLASMRAGYRRQALATLRARERLGITVRTTDDYTADCARIFPLYEQVMDRAEFQLERLNRSFFERLGANLPDETSALLVEREDELIAAAVLLRSPALVTFLLAGLDYGQHRKLQSYNLLVMEVVAAAIRSGAAALEMGQTSYASKQRLGAQPTSRHIFLRARGPLLSRTVRFGGDALFPEVVLDHRQVFRRE